MFSLPLVARFGGGGLNGPIVPLHDMLYVDRATVVPAGNQTGNIETPYATIAQAIASLGALSGTITIVPGDYSSEGVLNLGAGAGIVLASATTGQHLGTVNASQVVVTTIAGITATRTVGLQSLLITGNISNIANILELVDCQVNGTIIAGDTLATACLLRNDIHAAKLVLVDSRISKVGGLVLTCTNGLIGISTSFLSTVATNLDVTGALDFDAYTAFQWHATTGSVLLHAGSFVNVVADTPAKMSQDLDGSGYALWHFENVKSAADLALVVGTPVAFPAFVLNAVRWGLINGHVYTVTLGVRVIQWKDDHLAAGCVEFVEDALVTVAAGVVTLVFNRVPVPDPRGLAGSLLLAGNAGLAASAGGFTVSVTRGAASNCHARWYAWFNRFDELLP